MARGGGVEGGLGYQRNLLFWKIEGVCVCVLVGGRVG